MIQSKEAARESILNQMRELMSNYELEGRLPTDRQITKLAHTFYERDKDRQVGADIEMMAVTRGIIQGMSLMRQIVENQS